MICSFDCTITIKRYIYKNILFRFRDEQNKASEWVRRERTKATWPTSDMKLNKVMQSISIERNNMVIKEERIHLYPYRTQKLSSSSLMVLRPQGLGRVGHSQLDKGGRHLCLSFFIAFFLFFIYYICILYKFILILLIVFYYNNWNYE